MRTGINPVTIRGTDNRDGKPVALALGRLHIGTGGKMLKMVSAVMFDESGAQPQNAEEVNEKIKAFAVIDEDLFVTGLQHLFPAGEVDQTSTSVAPTNEELVDLLKSTHSSGTNKELIRATLLKLGVVI